MRTALFIAIIALGASVALSIKSGEVLRCEMRCAVINLIINE